MQKENTFKPIILHANDCISEVEIKTYSDSKSLFRRSYWGMLEMVSVGEIVKEWANSCNACGSIKWHKHLNGKLGVLIN